MTEASSDRTTPVLEVSDLHVGFRTGERYLEAVSGVDFRIGNGDTVGLVGESGCGKSVTAFSIMRLLPPNARATGKASLHGRELFELSRRELRSLRGREISMIFQEPMSALNPVLTIANQIMEPLRMHGRGGNKSEMAETVIDLLERVGIARAEIVGRGYPHVLSGGMRQRVMIAMAIAMRPSLVIADEPTTALDVTIQAQILELLRRLQQETQTSLLLITHDLGVVAEMCERVLIMYLGRIVESSTTAELFTSPAHPYTRGLLSSIPSLTSDQHRLKMIPGQVPSLLERPAGCPFAPRCEFAMDICHREVPSTTVLTPAHSVDCWWVEREGGRA